MKKYCKLIIMVIAVTTLVLTGCGKKNKVIEHDASQKDIEVSEDLQNATLTDSKDLTTTLENDDENEDSEGEKIFISFKRYAVDGKTFATVKGYDKADKLLWSYTTEKEDVMQIENYDLLGGFADKVFVREDGCVTILNAKDGKVINKTKNIGANVVFLGYGRQINSKEQDDYKDYYFFMSENLVLQPTSIVALDSETGKIVNNYKLPDEYKQYSYEKKKVEGAPTDTYVEFTLYTANEKVNNKYGFYVTETLNKNFKAKVIK